MRTFLISLKEKREENVAERDDVCEVEILKRRILSEIC